MPSATPSCATTPPWRAPPGYYLGGVAVDPAWRRHGIGTSLTECRLASAWDKGAQIVYYFANARNEASIAMHEAIGFEELRRPFTFPGVMFDGGTGTGVLFGIARHARSGRHKS